MASNGLHGFNLGKPRQLPVIRPDSLACGTSSLVGFLSFTRRVCRLCLAHTSILIQKSCRPHGEQRLAWFQPWETSAAARYSSRLVGVWYELSRWFSVIHTSCMQIVLGSYIYFDTKIMPSAWRATACMVSTLGNLGSCPLFVPTRWRVVRALSLVFCHSHVVY